MDDSGWNARAELAQASLEKFFGTDRAGLPVNTIPRPRGPRPVLNYWWVANLIQTRVAARDRPGGERWVADAETLFHALVRRNHGLFNDYFDDMLWLALAALDLHDATGSEDYLNAGIRLWEHVTREGGNTRLGGGIAWRTQQPAYKNAPTNLLYVILSLRLDRDDAARAVHDWVRVHLVEEPSGPDPTGGAHGFRIADGINRTGDNGVDWDWQFSYNYGLLIGAHLEWARRSDGDRELSYAFTVAQHAIRRFGHGDALFPGENDPGDAGLFKGVLFRYLGALWQALPDPARRETIELFVMESTDRLWRHATGDGLLVGNDWKSAQNPPFAYSAEISAIIATEVRALIEKPRVTQRSPR